MGRLGFPGSQKGFRPPGGHDGRGPKEACLNPVNSKSTSPYLGLKQDTPFFRRLDNSISSPMVRIEV